MDELDLLKQSQNLKMFILHAILTSRPPVDKRILSNQVDRMTFGLSV
jgi:hypothetical protein